MNASDIAAEIKADGVVANHRDLTYWVVGDADGQYNDVGDYSNVPDPHALVK